MRLSIGAKDMNQLCTAQIMLLEEVVLSKVEVSVPLVLSSKVYISHNHVCIYIYIDIQTTVRCDVDRHMSIQRVIAQIALHPVH